MRKNPNCYIKKDFFLIIFLLLFHFSSFAQNNKIEIKYSIKNTHSFLYQEKVIEGDTLVGYAPLNKIFFKNRLNLKCYFFDDKVYLNNKVIYCFKNVQYYETLLFVSFNNREFLYIYPHYYGRVGPYIWYELGVLIEIKPIPVIKENMDYFEDYELDRLFKFKNYKIRSLKNTKCD